MIIELACLAATVAPASTTASLSDLKLEPAATPAATVQELAAAHPQRLGLGEGDTLLDVQVVTLRRGYVVRARRAHQERPVIDETLAVRLDAEGRPRWARTDFAPLPLLGDPKVSPEAAVAAAALAVRGLRFTSAEAAKLGARTLVVVEPRRAALAYVVHLPGVLPWQRRNVLVDAVNGAVLEVRVPVRQADNDAAVYLPHPDPGATLGDPAPVELERLTEQQPLVPEGDYVTSLSCLTEDDAVRVITCLDVYNGLACFEPSVKDLVVAFCGEGHRAQSQPNTGLTFDPVDDLTDYVSGAVFADPFAEVHAYYHLDAVTDWLSVLGHPVALHTPHKVLVNVTLPSPELLECASTAWAAETNRSSARAREIVTACTTTGPRFMGLDNAFSLGDDLDALLGITRGIYMGQGTTADFAYDGDIIYHEYGHAVATQLNALSGVELLGLRGLDDSPGALGEAFADYFAAAFTEDPVVGGYVGQRLGSAGGIRSLDHDLVCPDYWVGEVHQDSMGFATALWAARELYPQTETDAASGRTLRRFDILVYEALATLTTQSSQEDAAQAIIQAVAAEPALEDSDAALATCALEARNVTACERVRPLCAQPIPVLFVAGKSPASLLGFGGRSFSPFAPGPVQLAVDVPAGVTSTTFKATVRRSMTSIGDAPDFLGGDTTEPVWDLRLVWRAGQPIDLTYGSGSTVTVAASASDGEIPLNLGAGGALSAPLTFPDGAERVYYVIANYTAQSAMLEDLELDDTAFVCPAAAPAPSSVQCTLSPPEQPPVTPRDDEDGGCGCSGAPAGLAALAALALLLRRRR